MRDRNSWHRPVSRELSRIWDSLPGVPDGVTPAHLCQVELGLRVLERLAPEEAAEGAYTLFGGYPFARTAGFAATASDEALLVVARHLLWTLRRGHAWRQALEVYRQVPAEVCAYALPPTGAAEPPRPRVPALAPDRIGRYDDTLSRLPDFVRRPLTLAPGGRSTFREQRRAASVDIPEELVFERPLGHDLVAGRTGGAAPLAVSRDELIEVARWMDRTERDEKVDRPGHWERRTSELTIALRDQDGGGFTDRDELRLDGLLHMVGMVGAGKSTLMTVVAVWAARLPAPLRTTIVVGDAAEQLRLCKVFAALGVPAVPLLGSSTRETHVQRLHRRLASRGYDNLLDHEDRAFDELSTVCVVSGLRGTESEEPLRYADAPCTALLPDRKTVAEPDEGDLLAALRDPVPAPPARPEPGDEPLGTLQGCPVWAECPRHGAARAQVDALVWVANPASLVQSPVASHLNDERLRQLELACLRSDIIFVDEADSVQMKFDQIFAPSATLVQPDLESWLDRLHTHKIEELCRKARLPLTDRQVQQWNTALGGVTLAVDPLCRQLITEPDTREWVDIDYFSPWTLQQKLLDEWFDTGAQDAQADETDLYEGYDDVDDAEAEAGAPGAPVDPRRAELTAILDAFRDDPFGDRGTYGTLTDALVDTVQDLLHNLLLGRSRARLRATVGRLLVHTPGGASPADRDEDWWDTTCRRVGFMLLLSALHQRLDRLTTLWPQVEAALRLDTQGKELARRAPLDYAPVIPEAPMGNVLGFQYLPDDQERDRNGLSGGTLRFFRCTGVGRELLLRLHEFGADPADGRPGPHVVLMSGTSWAGESTRAHVLAPVGAVLKPSPESLEAVAETTFSTHFLYDDKGAPMSLSGTRPKDRLAQARAMAAGLGRGVAGMASPLDQELIRVPDDHRKRALLLVGSYREAYAVADTLDAEERWQGRVRVLMADDADAGVALHGTGLLKEGASVLRRGDLELFADDDDAEVLVAPLLAVERGHNILNAQRKAAFGTTLFLVRPHPRPDDLALSIFAINDWISRFVRDHPRGDDRRGPATFSELVAEASSLAEAGQLLRHEGRQEWRRLLSRRYVYSYLPAWEKRAFAWDQLVTMWQVIGRLVRGGVPARVVFVDAAFAPRLARALSPGAGAPEAVPGPDGLLKALGAVLAPYLTGLSAVDPADAELARLLYQPFYNAMCRLSHH
ncbi:hypothetical protein ACFVUH_02890 [Kitasatospora sp. NPDC058032]|uniref:pPIWI_RE_Z domain-containing protein n=1 Tax=Kitasatospora sp. NPDC058032 TaxID=3346307 RepID=UPI0036DFA168